MVFLCTHSYRYTRLLACIYACANVYIFDVKCPNSIFLSNEICNHVKKKENWKSIFRLISIKKTQWKVQNLRQFGCNRNNVKNVHTLEWDQVRQIGTQYTQTNQQKRGKKNKHHSIVWSKDVKHHSVVLLLTYKCHLRLGNSVAFAFYGFHFLLDSHIYDSYAHMHTHPIDIWINIRMIFRDSTLR